MLNVLLNLYECEVKNILSLINNMGTNYRSILKGHQIRGNFLKFGGSWNLNYLSRNSNKLTHRFRSSIHTHVYIMA